ncbi:response regulator [Chitinophaga sp. SYP-B3965]|uniref:LytR/AlgR family response regulator transcription factor n=1 Tax=Chitinophaga sp. SYP-B3965 TaxID=2663120 RepID=UPI00129A0803|nr:LytTR family DNA-binding domain-containing protein [Chitinophaga sp. SYP-B3965]MRG43917.1 response regulator [Chitinophaga sp. SYP-B3965]
MIRILIVDDEPSAGNILHLLIEKHIAGQKEIRICQSPEVARDIIPVFKPSLLMLDIEMPHMNGFDLLNRIGQWDFDVIFTTAYDKYAIKAIRFSALDYLLKPIDIPDLQNAINRHIVRQNAQPREQGRLVDNLISNLQQKDTASFKLALSTMDGVFFYDPADILKCEGDDNYTHFYFIHHKPLIVSRTLKDFEEILTDHGFMRVHKSYLVNMHYVEKLDKEGLLWLSDGSNAAVSRRRRKDVLDVLSRK